MTLIDYLLKQGIDKKEASALIMSGSVFVNEEKIIIGSTPIKETDVIRIKYAKEWVSRGAYKLLEAFNKFNIDVTNKICLDVGSSTGGFTEVLLSKGANIVYALDSGTNQLDYKLRSNLNVISMEKTNLKSINKQMFKSKIDFLCCDVSFISVKQLFNVLANEEVLNQESDLVILIKPQFEANSSIVEKGGYVDIKYHNEIISTIINYASNLGFKFIDQAPSPIKGNKSKNIEYLAHFRR